MRKTPPWHLLLVALLPWGEATASAYGPTIRRLQAKKASRWSIEDALRRRTRNAWMPWTRGFEMQAELSMGSPRWTRDGMHEDFERQMRMMGGGVQFHLSAVGIGISREIAKKSPVPHWQRDEATLYLRLIGSSNQSTQLTALAGYQQYKHKDYGSYTPRVYGWLATLYMTRYTGLEFDYRQIGTVTNKYYTFMNENYHYGVFWELSILRIYFNYYHDYIESIRLNQREKFHEAVKGFQFGGRLYF